MNRISAWYKLNFSKSHMRRIQYVDPVGYSKMARRVRICHWTKVIVVLSLMIAVSLGILYWASSQPDSTNKINSTLPTSTEKLLQTETTNICTTSVESRKDGISSNSDNFASTASSTEKVSNQIPRTTTGLGAGMQEDSTKQSDASSSSSTPSSDELIQKLATVKKLGVSGKIENCSTGNAETCFHLESTGSFMDSSRLALSQNTQLCKNMTLGNILFSSGNASEGFVVVRVKGSLLWQLYCGSSDTFAKLSPIICVDLGFSELDFLKRFPLAELKERGINISSADNATDIDGGSDDPQKKCHAGYLRCK